MKQLKINLNNPIIYLLNKKILFFLIITIKINFILTKSIHIYTNSEQEITLSLLQGECTLIPCGDTFCSKNGGICENTPSGKVCKCKEYFTTPTEDEFYNCCYKQKSAIKAFFLEAFLIFGFGHFYIGNKKLGIIKDIVYAILFLFTFIIFFRRIYNKNRFIFNSNIIIKMFKTFCVLACGCTFIIWQMTDSVLFCLGIYTDGNGVRLY